MVPGFVLRVSWILLLFGFAKCAPYQRYDHRTSAETTNLDFEPDPEPGYQPPPSYMPKEFSLTYEPDSDSGDSEDDTPWTWRHSTYKNPEKTRQQSGPGKSGSEELRAWYGLSNPSGYAGWGYPGGAGPVVYGGMGSGGYATGMGTSAYPGGVGPGVYAGGIDTSALFGKAGGMGSGVYPGVAYPGSYASQVVHPRAGGVGSGGHASGPSSMVSDRYPSQSVDATLSSLGGSLMEARQLPINSWNARQVPEQLIAKPPELPSSLVVQSRGTYERARDFRADMKYNQNTFDFIPPPEMQKLSQKLDLKDSMSI